jgi:zinc protease
MKPRFLLPLLAAATLAAQYETIPFPGPRTTAKKAAPSRRATTAPAPSYKDLKYPPLTQVKIPDVTSFTLANGMKVYLLENHELPTVNGMALVRTGNLFDPSDKIGLAELTGTVLRTGGTKELTGDQIDERLENVAASVESQIGETSAQVSFFCLKDNTGDVMKVFRDLMVAPEFRQDKLDLAKTYLRGSIARRNDSAPQIASREFQELIYGKDTPYGARLEYEHVSHVQRADLAAFHKRYFFPKNTMLAVYGDFSTSEMKAQLEKLFADWTAEQPAAPPFPEVRKRPRPGAFLAVKEDVTQTFFKLGHLGGRFDDKDYPALEVMSYILGGSFSSRLVKKVRTELGYAYSIGASWSANFTHPGTFVISGSTKSMSTVDSIQAVRTEIDRMRSEPVADAELETAKQTTLNSFVFNFDTPYKTLSRMIRYEYHGYPKDFIFQYQKAIAAVTKQDVLRVAKQYLKPEEFTIAAVGKPSDFGKPLADLGVPVSAIDLKIPEPKQEHAKADAASLEQGRKILAAAQQALGGADKLAAVKDYTITAQVEFSAAGGAKMKAKQTTRWLTPSHMRQENELPFGKMAMYFDGTIGWLVSPQGSMPLGGPVLKQVREQVFRNLFTLLTSDRDATRTVNAAGDGVVEISDKQGNLVMASVDPKTGMPLKLSYQSVQAGGPAGKVDEVYAEWKDVGGIKLPHKITMQQGERVAAEVNIQQWTLNSGLTADDVSKRP